jgi:predicted MFS family arabinose efflux permease
MADAQEIPIPENIGPAKFSAVFSNIGFLFLWIGQLFSQLADRVFIYVLMIMAYNLTNSNIGVAVPLLAFGIPSLLFGSFAGVFVDRLDRKGILIVSDLIRGALILLLIPLVESSLVLIFVVSFFIYTVAQFFAPAETSAIPELVEKKNLIVANSLFMITWVGSSMIGIGLGAPLVGMLGEEATFVVAACFYFISAGAILMIPLKYKKSRKGSSTKEFLKEFLAGLEFIRRNFIINYSLIKMFVATSAIAVISLLAISYAKEILGIGAENFGYLIISVGVGMMVGLPLLSKLSHRVKKGTLVIIGFLLSGLTLIALPYTDNLNYALILTFVLGISNILVTSSIQTILQQMIPRSIRGRVFGVQNMLINSAFVVPVVIWGIIADTWGIQPAISLLGAIVLAVGLASIFVPKFKNV